MVAAITATDVLTVWPPRKEITLTGLDGSESVTINRIVGGARTPLRGYEDRFVGTTTRVLTDAESPFGLPVTYELLLSGTAVDTDGPATLTLTGGNVALTDAISGLSSEVVILAHDDLVADAEATVFGIDGRNYVVGDPLGQEVGLWEFYTETTTAKTNLDALLRLCTSNILQMRQPGGYDGVDGYYSPLTMSTRRFSQDGSDQRRITAVRLAATSAWPDVLETRGFTLQDVADAYAGQTLTDLAGDYATLLLLAQGDFS
jgi:hypothetical protein